MKAVIYARYSSDNQREESIEGQVRECKEFAEKNDIVIIGEYIDRALTAKTDNRPNFQKMIKDSAKHVFVFSYGNWTVLPATAKTAHITKTYSKRTA